MPKERRTRSKSRASPLPFSSSSYQRHSSSSSSSRNQPESSVAAAKDLKEWEEIRCPVCMEHPHNAVLLLCSSYDKGCRPFMCDTSYRHSNCFDQYRKTSASSSTDDEEPPELSCPLCRGAVSCWIVMEAAREFMNARSRSCALESCGFVGTYGELRKHARKEHPWVRPSEADPERERDWRRMEQQRDIEDLFSTMQSAVGVEDGGDEEDDFAAMFRLPTPFMLFLVLRVSSLPGGTGRSVRLHRGSSRRAGILWGESYSELESSVRAQGNGEVVDNPDEEGGPEEASSAPRREQGRPRRQLIISDEEDDVDDVDLEDMYM